ncbi:DUF4192 domain-containing protein [Symbioplanes lichenis]|uniref:DUF4192 domain-containing protein n=1 Tax=Symbioplanes lichenis TaxID=1629072 RepID=UPI0027382FF9|nr:DUF4192 domain-containing protein [Actinoplanes lichenis]
MTPLNVSSPSELLSLVPYLVGFHPEHSLVVVAVYDHQLGFTTRIDLPERESWPLLRHVAATVAQHRPDAVLLIGYGPSTPVTPAVKRLAGAFAGLRLPVLDELRVDAGRYWSLLCDDPGCCPAEGRPCPPLDSVLAAEATFAGAVALPSRKDLEVQLAPVSGAARDAMDKAEVRALARLLKQSCLAVDEQPHGSAEERASEFDQFLFRIGRTAVQEAEQRYRSGGTLSDDEVAWLVFLLEHAGVRDYAWTRTGVDEWQIAFWSDIARRTSTSHVAAPAGLLSFVAWRANQGALANVAVGRALAAEPDYLMARIMHTVLAMAIPPAMLDGWPEIPGLAGEVLEALAAEFPVARDLLPGATDEAVSKNKQAEKEIPPDEGPPVTVTVDASAAEVPTGRFSAPTTAPTRRRTVGPRQRTNRRVEFRYVPRHPTRRTEPGRVQGRSVS